MLTYLASWQRNRGAAFARTANSAHPSLVPAQNFRTADGHLALFVGNDGMWRRFVDVVGDAALATRQFATREGRLEHRDEVIAGVQRGAPRRTSREWEARLGEVGVACGTVNDVAGALVEPQTRARGLVVQNEHPAYGRYEHVRGPLPTQAPTHIGPAPLLGEHTTRRSAASGYPAGSHRRAARRPASCPESAHRSRSGGAAALVGLLDHPPVVVGRPTWSRRTRSRRRRGRGARWGRRPVVRP